ncbi:MAG TPA: ABC transporter ATP-binding protein [Candidatus Limnocylindrales bacterium]|nr:ABC transporter ATP-binding protein [Candidatus Limnocylindrales bacterium]
MLKFLLKVWSLAKPYRTRLFLGVLTGILTGLVSPLVIGTVMFVYSAVFPTTDPSGMAQLPMQKLPVFAQHWFYTTRQALESGVQTHPWAVTALIVAIPFIMFLSGFFGYLNVYLLQWVAARTIADLRVRLFRHLLDLSAGFYSENASGQLISRVMNDTGALQNILNNAVSVVVRDPVKLVGVLAFLFWQQPKLTLITVVFLPACIIPIAIFNRKIRRSSRELQTQTAELTQTMAEAFTGHRIVKAYNLEPIVAGQFQDVTRRYISHYMRITRAGIMPGPLIEFFGSCGVALLLAYLIYRSEGHPNPAAFLQLIGSIFFMYQPLKNLTQLQNQIVQARAASERAFALLETQTTVLEPAQPRKLQAAGADIQFEHVDFSYGEKVALSDINLEIKSGRLVALVGASGSGKTTLANLLLRFYDPQRGVIKIRGVNIRDVSTRDLRSQIAVVTQEVILFDDTIRRNIELGRPGATHDEIIAAAKHAHAYDFIMQRPEGFEAIIGEKGVMLSGGQRQRIAIARAVLRNAPILVLDEATSALDTESERAVQAALDELMKGRTTICIAHRLSTVLHADLIVVLDQGRIVETGRHEDLVQRGGVYQKLYELQFAS